MDCICVNDEEYCKCRNCKQNESNGGDCSHCVTCITGEKAMDVCDEFK